MACIPNDFDSLLFIIWSPMITMHDHQRCMMKFHEFNISKRHISNACHLATHSSMVTSRALCMHNDDGNLLHNINLQDTIANWSFVKKYIFPSNLYSFCNLILFLLPTLVGYVFHVNFLRGHQYFPKSMYNVLCI